jgi:DNA-binding response OmpR family regulator
VIAIASSAAVERAALAALCEHRGWNAFECRSVRDIKRLITRVSFKVVLARFQLQDGYSDDVIEALAAQKRVPAPKIIVLLTADATSSTEARQLLLGADSVQRDPVRSDVLLAYVEKYLRKSPKLIPHGSAPQLQFSGATVNVLDRTLQYRERTVVLTPREVTLLELLAGAGDEVVTYESLYSEILGRRFRGDTSNMRVLLAKLSTSAAQVGFALRHCVDVIPKTGYRFRPPAAKSPDTGAARAIQ